MSNLEPEQVKQTESAQGSVSISFRCLPIIFIYIIF